MTPFDNECLVMHLQQYKWAACDIHVEPFKNQALEQFPNALVHCINDMHQPIFSIIFQIHVNVLYSLHVF